MNPPEGVGLVRKTLRALFDKTKENWKADRP